MKIEKTDLFEADVRHHLVFDLASKNPYAADHYLLEIDRLLKATADYPLSKQELPHLGSGIRGILVHPYTIFYAVRGDVLRALRFMHSHQNITEKALRFTDN